MSIGRKVWAIAEGYIPAPGDADDDRLISHETWCILNASDRDATITATVYYTDRAPVGPYLIEVPAQRTLHVRVDQLTSPSPVPRETDYAAVLEADVPVVVQHTRLDARQSALALFSTLAFGD